MERATRWAGVVAAALGLWATTAAWAQLPGYTFKCVAPANGTGEFADGGNYQMGGVNDKGQMSFVINTGGEKVFAFDGTQVIKVSDDTIKLPDGSSFINDVWTSLDIGDTGRVAWIASTDSSRGQHYVMTYDLNSRQYEIVARPGDPVDGGGTLGSGEAWGASARWYASINGKDQTVFNANFFVGEATNSGVFMHDPLTKKVTKVARLGDTLDGKKLTNAWWPSNNDAGQVVFCANVDESDNYGIYVADSNRNFTTIVAPGTKVGNVTISSARWPHIANSGDVVFVGDIGESQGGASDPDSTDGAGVFLFTAADKKLIPVVLPGDTVPGGTFAGVANRRRTVQVNSKGQVAFPATRQDGGEGIFVWQNGKIGALLLGGSTVAGLGRVDGATVGNGGVTGWHFAMSENGHMGFPAVIDGVECFVLAIPLKQ